MERTWPCINMGLRICLWVKYNDSWNIWSNVYSRRMPALMTSQPLMTPQKMQSDVPESVFLIFWMPSCCSLGMEEKSQWQLVILVIPSFLVDLLQKTSRHQCVLSTMEPVQKHWLNVWQFMHNISWDTELILPVWCSICCWMAIHQLIEMG